MRNGAMVFDCVCLCVDILVQNDAIGLTHVVVAVQGVGWAHPDALTLMVMQSIVGAWDRNAGNICSVCLLCLCVAHDVVCMCSGCATRVEQAGRRG